MSKYSLTPKAKKAFDKYTAWKTPAFYSLLIVFVYLFFSVNYFPQYSIFVFIPFLVLGYCNLMIGVHYLKIGYHAKRNE